MSSRLPLLCAETQLSSRDIYTGISSEVKQPCQKKKVDTRQQVYTVEQAAHLLYLCKQQEPMIYLPMLLAVTAGLRISEITGLRYSDIDFLGRTFCGTPAWKEPVHGKRAGKQAGTVQ